MNYVLRIDFVRHRLQIVSVSSVAQSCMTLCDPMNSSTPGPPVHHQLSEFTQIHFHWVSDAIQPSHSLSSLFLQPPILPSIRVFSNESTFQVRWPKYWSFSFSIIPSKEHPGLISFKWTGLISLLEKCKSKLQWDITSHWSEWPSSKSLQMINAGEDVEKREHSCTVSGNVNW